MKNKTVKKILGWLMIVIPIDFLLAGAFIMDRKDADGNSAGQVIPGDYWHSLGKVSLTLLLIIAAGTFVIMYIRTIMYLFETKSSKESSSDDVW